LEILGDITREALSNMEEFWKVAGDSMEVVMQETAKGLSEVITAGSTQPLKDLAARLEDIVEAVSTYCDGGISKEESDQLLSTSFSTRVPFRNKIKPRGQ
jgi:hypothetical protein